MTHLLYGKNVLGGVYLNIIAMYFVYMYIITVVTYRAKEPAVGGQIQTIFNEAVDWSAWRTKQC